MPWHSTTQHFELSFTLCCYIDDNHLAYLAGEPQKLALAAALTTPRER